MARHIWDLTWIFVVVGVACQYFFGNHDTPAPSAPAAPFYSAANIILHPETEAYVNDIVTGLNMIRDRDPDCRQGIDMELVYPSEKASSPGVQAFYAICGPSGNKKVVYFSKDRIIYP